MTSRCALYHMRHNAYLGRCLAIVFEPTADAARTDHLQAPYILALVSSLADLSAVRSPAALRTSELFDSTVPIALRIGSECMLGIFGDSHCECEVQRMRTLREIATMKQGLYIHMPQEAQGNGLLYKAQELQLQVSGVAPDGAFVGAMSVTDASRHLLGDEPLEKRQYTSLTALLDYAGLRRYCYEIITESPQKAEAARDLLKLSISAVRSVAIPVTIENAGEYLGKLYNKHYRLTPQELEDIYLTVSAADPIPPRVLGLLHDLEDDLGAQRTFPVDNVELLRKIATIPAARGITARPVDGLGGRNTYEEYQVELRVIPEELHALFTAGVLLGLSSLAYEENHFYDLTYFEDAPARSLKIRYAYRVWDAERTNPIERKFIYKTLIQGNKYRIRAVALSDEDVARLLDAVLRDRERHVLPVLTHNVVLSRPDVTVLIKRYATELRTLSIMGPQAAVEGLVQEVRRHVAAPEIEDPTNFRFLRPRLPLEFDRPTLSREELQLFRQYTLG